MALTLDRRFPTRRLSAVGFPVTGRKWSTTWTQGALPHLHTWTVEALKCSYFGVLRATHPYCQVFDSSNLQCVHKSKLCQYFGGS